ncbi:hypothetical protein SAMN05660462_00445 [Proteiniborus ethanoligenes]|uniref:DUF3899 domain-containing protein n=1 Tax=Proteiniborus ethanoligenes TaxID=415015 RepID=A0A1H3L9K5_9FIRM|nr:hypothetical protein [Proteiniborus ethanoligenes]SDY61071.1 hypothetical protein SAMN05660462_00445 [Proteiniborus ethanoligenes]
MSKKHRNNETIKLLRKKILIKIAIVTLALIGIVFLVAFIKHGKQVSSVILSDYYFVVGTIILSGSVLMRIFAWLIHKRFILKPGNFSETDTMNARMLLKFLTKVLLIIGTANIILSLIFTAVYYVA